MFCNKHLQWYKQAGELQGSIERNALKQLDIGNQYGVYVISSSREQPHCQISLEIRDCQYDLSHARWNVSEIQELASKLVLVIRKKMSNDKEKVVDEFKHLDREKEKFEEVQSI